MSLLYRRRRGAEVAVAEERHSLPGGWSSWAAYQNWFAYEGHQYVTGGGQAPSGLLASCGPAFALLDRRQSVLGEVRPTFQRLERGKPTGFFSTPALGLLERPWPGGTFRDLVAICELDAAAAGNSYWVRRGAELVRLHPDWVTVAVEEVQVDGVKVGHRLLGYAVAPHGATNESVVYMPGEVAHYAPMPSPDNPFRGQSWLASVLTDATADMELTRYKSAYLRNGAMPSVAVTYETGIDPAQLEEFVAVFASKFTGAMNAGKVMHFLGGRDVKTVGATLDQLAFKATQGAGETRLAAAAGVPAVVAGFSEGMQGSSLNAGNYVATRRLFADAKMRPLLTAWCGAFANLVDVPSGARLWYDESGASFFQEDVADEANIRASHAQTVRTLIEAGYEPDAAVEAATTGDFSKLIGQHTGLSSVQLQPPSSGEPPAPQPVQEGDE